MTSDEYQAREQQRRAEHKAMSDQHYAELQALVLKIDREKKERDRMTTPREKWTPQMHLDDALARLTPVHQRAMKAREQLRVDLAALDTEKSRRILSEIGRREQRDAAITKARAVVDECHQAQQIAEAMLERRAAMTGPQRIFREARFAPVDPDNPLLSEMVEELKRMRIENRLSRATPEQFAEDVREAIATHNRAFVNLAMEVYQQRSVRGGEKGLISAGAALQTALQMELPKDVAQLEARFAEVETIKSDLDVTIPELRTGQPGDDLKARAKRALELGQELGPEAGPAAYVEEQQAIRKDRTERAKHRADQVIVEAVLSDESEAAAAFTIPISTTTPNPAE